MSNTEVNIDARQVLNLFAELSPKKQQKVYKQALKRASNILVRETKKQLKANLGDVVSHKNWWNGRTLQSGIKSSIAKDGQSAKVYIMGDFRLKFFEKGTNNRLTKGNSKRAVKGETPTYRQKKGANRGSIKPLYFFKASQNSKESEIFSNINNYISQSIQRVAK